MNILFLAPRLPLPADTGGKIRTFNILKELARKNRIHLMCFSFEEKDKDHTGELEHLGIRVTLVPIEPMSIIQKFIGVLLDPTPFSISKYDSLQMRQTIQTLLSNQSFDAVHVDHLHMAQYRDCFPGIPCFLDEHNVEYKILERCAEVERSWLKKKLYQSQAAKMKTYESQEAGKFKGIFACSEDDRQLLNTLTAGSVPGYVIPNGVNTEFFDHSHKQSHPEDTLVFTGSMDWLPNDDAITYFCGQILPLVWQKNSAVKLYVVGKNPSSSVKALAGRDQRVIVTGRVEDVRPYIERSSVFIVPLRIGGGTRLKILEAMSMSKAVVSTTIGAEGIECTSGVDIALADTPQEFAQKVVELCQDPARVSLMGDAGRKLACQKYDWRIAGDKINNIYKEAVHAS